MSLVIDSGSHSKQSSGMYSEEQKKAIVTIAKNVPVEEVLKYVDENADQNSPSFSSARKYIVEKGNSTAYDILLVYGQIIIHYANQSSIDNYYYTLRICAFTHK